MNKAAAIIMGNALVCGLVMIVCSMALKGTEAFKEIQVILSGGSLASLITVAM